MLLSLPSLRAQAESPELDALSTAFSERAKRREEFKNRKVLDAVDLGIGWLLSHQEPNGFWDLKDFMRHDPESDRCDGAGLNSYTIGVTSLALMAILAQGDPLHHDACHRAADWLAEKFTKKGRISDGTSDFIYSQALATDAMVEAAAILGRESYRKVAQSGFDYLESHRSPGAGWRYQPKSGESDTSVLSWCMSAYFAGSSIGLDVNPKTIGEAISWLDSVTNHATGHTGYVKIGEGSARMAGKHGTDFPIALGEALTASGLHARFMAGLSPNNELAIKAADILINKPPQWRKGAIDFYYWLQGSIAMEQMIGSPQHRRWRAALHQALLPNQCQKGAARGSWDPVGAWSQSGGRVYATAMNVLSLSSDYRYGSTHALSLIPGTPSFRRIANAWRKDRIGEAAEVLRKLNPEELTPREQVARTRLLWHVIVAETKAENNLTKLAQRWPDPVARVELLQGMADNYEGLPVGDAIAKALKELLDDPKVQAEIDANKALAKLQKDYETAVKDNNRPRRRTVGAKLRALVEKYPGTAAAVLAEEMAQRVLRGT